MIKMKMMLIDGDWYLYTQEKDGFEEINTLCTEGVREFIPEGIEIDLELRLRKPKPKKGWSVLEIQHKQEEELEEKKVKEWFSSRDGDDNFETQTYYRKVCKDICLINGVEEDTETIGTILSDLGVSGGSCWVLYRKVA